MPAKRAPTFDGRHTRLTENPDGTMTVKAQGRTLKHVRVRVGRPLYKPADFATVMVEHKGEAALIINLPSLDAASKAALANHRARHDLTCTILRVVTLDHQFGSAFWEVETDKGIRQFVIRGTTEHVRWLTDDRQLITDVNGNRFEIPSLTALDKRSQNLIALIL